MYNVDIRSKPDPFSFLTLVFEFRNNCARQLSGQCPLKLYPKLTAQDTANRKNILERAALHMVGAPKFELTNPDLAGEKNCTTVMSNECVQKGIEVEHLVLQDTALTI